MVSLAACTEVVLLSNYEYLVASQSTVKEFGYSQAGYTYIFCHR